MTSDSYNKSILELATPLIVSFWMRAAFTFVDTIYASLLGDSAVAAIGLTFPFEFLWIACWVGSSTGLTSCLSRALGSQQEAQWRQYLSVGRTMVGVLIPLFVLIGVGIYFYAPKMGLDPNVERDFQIYGAVLIGGSALTSFWSVIPDSMIKAFHDTRTTMWAGIIANVINLILNTFFLFVLEWGIFGIALSTVLGRIGSFLYAFWKAREHEKKRASLDVSWKQTEDNTPFKSVLKLALPSAMTFGLMSTEPAVLNWLFSQGENPTQAIAAYSIYFRVVLFALQPLIAVGVAALPYTGKHFGASNITAIRGGLYKITKLGLIYSVALIPLFAFGSSYLARFLSENPVTREYSTFALYLVPVLCLFGGPFLYIRPIFEGMQRGWPGLNMALVKFAILTPPLAFLGAHLAQTFHHAPFYGILLAQVFVNFVSSLAFYAWILKELRRQEEPGKA